MFTGDLRAKSWHELKTLALSLVFIFLFSEIPCQAAGPASVCRVTIRSVELKNTAAQWVTVIEPDKQVDLVNQESTIYFFNNTNRVPPGKYVNFRVKILETIKVQGRDHANRTKAGGIAVVTGRTVTASELPKGIASIREEAPTWKDEKPEELMTVILNLNNGDEDDTISIMRKSDFDPPLEVKKGSFISVRFDLNLDNVIYYGLKGSLAKGIPEKDTMYFLPPNQVERAEVEVGGRKLIFEGRELDLWF